MLDHQSSVIAARRGRIQAAGTIDGKEQQ